MEKIVYILLILVMFSQSNAVLFRPFPEGYSMGNLGTIFYENSPAEFDAFSPASLLKDTLHVGFSFSTTTYYDEMDNYQDLSIYSINLGVSTGIKNFGLKTGISELNVLGIYKEQCAILSAAISPMKRVKIGSELYATRFILYKSIHEEDWFTMVNLGFSVRITFSYTTVITRIENIAKKYWRYSNSNYESPPLSFTLNLNTKHLTIGAQGISLRITPDYEKPLSFALGMEFEIFGPLKIQCAIAENPFFVALGVTLLLNRGNLSFALVNHPVLGWSKDVEIQYHNYLHKKN